MTRQLSGDGPIAIVGMAARFPGAADVDEFRDAVLTGRESIRDLGEEELLGGGVKREWLGDPDYVRALASIDDVDLFDAAFFDVSGREAAVMDPQHRIFLETCWHALEHAGLSAPVGTAANVGVFAGSGGVLTSYLPDVLAGSGPLEDPTASLEQIGSDKDFLATRVSYKLNLTGPSLTVQTACSTSLVAVHLAVQSLVRGECEAALAGGVNIRLPHAAGYWHRRGGILSPDGRCRPFDVSAQGTIFGSGVGAVVLKPLDAAQRDGDTVYATILGTAINNDGGGKSSYGAAGQPGQLAAMRQALAVAGVDPATIGYVEAHGTGVPLGDPTEVGALKKIFGRDAPTAIGSVKALIGHMEAASGIAGLIKAALALHAGRIPPSPYFTAPHPRLKLDETGLFVNAEPLPMPGSPRRAAVNSLGIGGTNAFAVLEQAPERPPADRRPGHDLVTISAKTADALRELATRWADRLREPGADLTDLARTSHVGRRALRHRLSVLADSGHTAAERFESWLRDGTGQADAGEAARTRPRVGFLFSGQSSEYAGMAVELYRDHPVFRAAVDRHAEMFRRLTGTGPVDVFADEAAQARAELLQPAVFLLQVALAEFWASCGVVPDAVAGHSLGEYAAACVAGVFSVEEGLELVCARGRAFAAVEGDGRMVAVGCTDVAELERLVEVRGASVAAYNAPERITVSGSDAAMTELENDFRRRGWGTIPLETTHAFHSPLVADAVPALVAAAARIDHRPPAVPMALNLTGTWSGGAELGSGYWGSQLTSPVRFAAGLGALLAGGCTVFVEVGPGRTLTTAGRAQSGDDVVWLPGLAPRNPDLAGVLAHLARLERAGVPVDWAAYYASLRAGNVPAPLYPFARTRHWISAVPPRAEAGSSAGPVRDLPELTRLALPQSAQRRYETTVAATAPRVLADHEIAGRLVVPGAYHTACLVEAVAAESAVVVEDLVFPRALEVAESARRVQLVLTPAGDRRFVAQSFSLAGGDALADESWQVHAEGRVQQADVPALPSDLTAYRAGTPVSAAELYPRFVAAGFRFGPAFQWIEQLRLDGEDSSGDLTFAAGSPRERTMALLDSCVQLAIAARIVRQAPEDGVLLPFRIERAVFHASRHSVTSGVALIRHRGAEGAGAVADVSLADHDGTPLLELFGLELRPVSFRSAAAAIYADDWEQSEAGGSTSAAGPWIVLGDRRGHWRQAVTALEANGGTCVIAETGTTFARHDDRYVLDPADADQLTRLFRETGPASVLHCLGLDAGDTRTACGSVPALVQATERVGWAPGSVVLLTRGAVPVRKPAEVGDPYGSMLWGLGRSAALEAPRLGVRLVDLDPRDISGALRLFPRSHGAEVAIRDGRSYRPVLRRESTLTARPQQLSSDGCYLITGGTGALGLLTAAWLSQRGVRHVVLASRRATEARAEVRELERSGVKVTLVDLDVTDEAAVGQVVERAQREWGGLRGVVHAAGMLDDAVLLRLTWDRFAPVLDPKVAGGWHLHRATLGLDLETFVLFSSTTALLGAPGQAHYAAANAFLDGLAHYRRGLGLPALSVDWGPWEAGMVARLSERLRSRMLDGGFTPLASDPAFAALDRLVAGPGGQYGVFTVDWSRYLARFSGGRAVAAVRDPGTRDVAESVRRLRRDSSGATGEHRRELVFDYLRGMLATRLGMAESAVVEDLSLPEAGLDSLVAVEVRGQIFRDLDVDLPLTGLLEGKALRLLVDELAGRMAPGGPAPRAESVVPVVATDAFSPQEAERLLADLDSLTEDQIQALLPWLADQDGIS